MVEKSVDRDRILRFGTFEADLQTAELRKAGFKIKLGGQAFQVLAVLLEQPSRLVTRDELQKRLWPDTFVDAEHNLNTAINRIREALGDSAENPRFIETLPRRGYRFIAPVTNGTSALTQPRARSDLHSVVAPQGTEQPATLDSNKLRLSPLILVSITSFVIATVVATAIASYIWTHRLQPPRVTGYSQITADSQAKTSSYVSELLSPIFSDGSRVYFMEGPVGNKRLVQVSTGGGDTTLLQSAVRTRRILDISSDRKALLVLTGEEPLQAELPLMILPIPAGSPRRVGNVLAHDASWSADGSEIVYANGHELYISDANGNGARKIAVLSGTAWWPRWSRDGRVIRFTVQSFGNWHKLWEVAADGSNLHPLFPEQNTPFFQCCGNWTPDGKYFVFASTFYSDSQLWVMRENRQLLEKDPYVRQLTTGPMNMFAPLPSQSGKKLFAIAVQQRGHLTRYDARTHEFMPFLSGISVHDVDFSKDGQWVTYVGFPDGTLWRSKADGSDKLQLTSSPMRASLPRWSPDGRRIAFLAQPDSGKPFKIYLVSASGSNPVQAIQNEEVEGEPSWAPDGNSIAFGPLFWLQKDPRPAVRLLDLRTGRVTILPGSDGLFSARWSPDGRYMAALTADSASTLVVLNLESHKWVELKAHAAYPNWSRDGHYVYFDDPYSDEPAIYRARVTDGSFEKVATLDPHDLSWAIVGKWTGLAADDSPLVLRDISIEELYSLDLDPQF